MHLKSSDWFLYKGIKWRTFTVEKFQQKKFPNNDTQRSNKQHYFSKYYLNTFIKYMFAGWVK